MSAPVAEAAGAPRGAPLARRLAAWAAERFPLAHAPLFLVLYLTALLAGRALALPGEVAVGAADLLMFAGPYGFFLMLRVMDEHKDYAADCVVHPQRVLQRGVVTLGQLRMLGVAAVVAQLAVSLWRDRAVGPATAHWALALGYSLLMLREFFAPAWLRPRTVLYAFVHMLVMPLAIVWMAQLGAGRNALPLSVAWLALLATASGFAFEIARKTRAPIQEREGVDSYTRSLGIRGAPLAIVTALSTSAAALVGLSHAIAGQVPMALAVLLVVGLALVALVLWRFASVPTAAAAKQVEVATSLAMLVGYLAALATVLAARGVRWT